MPSNDFQPWLGPDAVSHDSSHIAPFSEVLRHPKVLPTWPVTALVAGFPLWWLLGLGSMIWCLAALPLALLLVRYGRATVPRGFGVWLFFLVWMIFSGVEIDTFGRMLGFMFRAGQYIGITVLFVYAYNLVRDRSASYLYGVLTAFLAGVVACGFLGLIAPTLMIRTPISFITPGFLMANDLVRDMVVVRTTQFNPDAWDYIDPRPSAPFLYTNNWGNAYSLLVPVVATYWVQLRRHRMFVPVGIMLAFSVVPAVLTLNRGMFLGVGLAVLILAVRHALSGNVRVLAGMSVLSLVAAAIFIVLPVAERLDNRLDVSGTNTSRTTVYLESFQQVSRSPLFGYGAPRPTESTEVPLGTQGQFWMVLFSHGYVGIALFMSALILLALATLRRKDMMGMALNASLVVLVVQTLYYGLLFQGLAVAALVGAAALQPVEKVDQGPNQAERSKPAGAYTQP